MAETITIVLSVEHMNIIAAAMQELPFRVAAPVISEIQKQVAQQKDRGESSE